MRDIKYTLLIILIGGILLAFFTFVNWNNKKSYHQTVSLNEEFPLLNDYNDSIKGVVINKESNINIRGARLFTLSDKTKFALGGDSYNYLYQEPSFIRFASINDSIYKPANNDSVYVYRDGKEYYFILGKILNKDEK